MRFLERADVFIRKGMASGCLSVVSGDNSGYEQMRSVMVSLSELMGLPITLLSESTAEACVSIHRKNGGAVYKGLTTEGRLRYGNEITVVAWRIGAGEKGHLEALAEEIAQEMRKFDLRVVVQL